MAGRKCTALFYFFIYKIWNNHVFFDYKDISSTLSQLCKNVPLGAPVQCITFHLWMTYVPHCPGNQIYLCFLTLILTQIHLELFFSFDFFSLNCSPGFVLKYQIRIFINKPGSDLRKTCCGLQASSLCER